MPNSDLRCLAPISDYRALLFVLELSGHRLRSSSTDRGGPENAMLRGRARRSRRQRCHVAAQASPMVASRRERTNRLLQRHELPLPRTSHVLRRFSADAEILRTRRPACDEPNWSASLARWRACDRRPARPPRGDRRVPASGAMTVAPRLVFTRLASIGRRQVVQPLDPVAFEPSAKGLHLVGAQIAIARRARKIERQVVKVRPAGTDCRGDVDRQRPQDRITGRDHRRIEVSDNRDILVPAPMRPFDGAGMSRNEPRGHRRILDQSDMTQVDQRNRPRQTVAEVSNSLRPTQTAIPRNGSR